MEEEISAIANNANTKAPRIRSVAYPSNTISHCKALVTKIHQIFGSTIFTDRKSLSTQLKISESHLQTQLSSCNQYGLLDLKVGEGYKPSNSFTTLYKPLNDEEYKKVQLECFMSPEIYKKIIEHFEGQQLPQEAGLAIILFRKYKIAENASTNAARIFLENVLELGLIKDGIFSVELIDKPNDDITFVEIEDSLEKTKLLPPINNDNNSNHVKDSFINELSDMPLIPILLEGNRVAHLYMPKGYTNKDFKRVFKVINAYLEDE